MTPRRFRRWPVRENAPAWRHGLAAIAVVLATTSAVLAADEPPPARLRLLADPETGATHVDVGLKKPFDVYLIAERDADQPEISTVAFTLELPEGLLLVGEDLLVESLIVLGTPRAGVNLAFHCVAAPRVAILRMRLVATRPLEEAAVRLAPDRRTNFLGIVSCKREKFEKWDVPPAELTVTAQ